MLHPSETPSPSQAVDEAGRDHAGGEPTEPVEVTGERSLARRLRLPALVALVVQAVLVAGDRLPSIDALAYFEAGRNLLEGNGYVRQGAPELHFPPVSAVGLAGLERLTGDEMHALWLWNLTWGLLLVAVLTAIAWWISRDDDTTVATAWLTTPVGGLIALSIRGGAGSEVPAATLVLAAVLLVLVTLDPAARRSAGSRTAGLAGAGGLCGLAYLARPEMLLPGLMVGAGAVAILLRTRAGDGRPAPHRVRRAGAGVAAFGLAALVFIAPYVGYQHAHTGTWSLTSKSKDASIEAWRDVARGDRLARDEVLYEIQSDGVSLGPETRSLTTLAREDPAGWLGIVWVNTTSVLRFYLLWQILPLYLLVPAAAKVWATRRRRDTLLLGAVGLAPLVTCLVFFTQSRYLMLTTAVLVPFGAWGLVEWARRRTPRVRRATWWVVGVLSVVSLAVGAWPLLPGSPHPERTEQRTAGQWLDRNTPADARIMTRSFPVQAYAHRPVVALPFASLDDTLAYARRMGVSYLVADETNISRRRPQLADALLAQAEAPAGLRLAHEFTQGDRTVRIFALDPPPPPSEHPPRPLGYVGD